MMAFANRYSALDRALHRLAFLSRPAQLVLADVEERLFEARLAEIVVQTPVFITALPRAGTTLLLEMCVTLEEFAAHCYRDMPFVLCPLLWERFSKRFRQADTPRERAHGDGMLVSVDSPEALEEMVWKAFWKRHYAADHIVPWCQEEDAEFSDFLRNHVRKIIALRQVGSSSANRYVSKNNLNIARIKTLRRIFPDAIVLAPFRDPLQHAASLLRQHHNFLAIHSRDRFARDYMAALGHYDFGANLRPINFADWFTSNPAPAPTTLTFWLAYWTATYRHLLTQADQRVRLLSYEALCSAPSTGLARIAEALEINARADFVAQASRLRLMKPHPVDTDAVDPTILQQATVLHGELKKAALV
jgi:hypothetical protein